jgi:hypothetical protein
MAFSSSTSTKTYGILGPFAASASDSVADSLPVVSTQTTLFAQLAAGTKFSPATGVLHSVSVLFEVYNVGIQQSRSGAGSAGGYSTFRATCTVGDAPLTFTMPPLASAPEDGGGTYSIDWLLPEGGAASPSAVLLVTTASETALVGTGALPDVSPAVAVTADKNAGDPSGVVNTIGYQAIGDFPSSISFTFTYSYLPHTMPSLSASESVLSGLAVTFPPSPPGGFPPIEVPIYSLLSAPGTEHSAATVTSITGDQDFALFTFTPDDTTLSSGGSISLSVGCAATAPGNYTSSVEVLLTESPAPFPSTAYQHTLSFTVSATVEDPPTRLCPVTTAHPVPPANAKTLLQLVQEFCRRQGLPRPTVAATANDDMIEQLIGLLNEVGEYITSRRNWTGVTFETVFPSIEGELQGALSVLAPHAFNRVLNETLHDRTDQEAIPGPVNPSDWQSRQASPATGPDHHYRIRGGQLLIHPAMPAGHCLAFEYVSSAICVDMTGATDVYKPSFTLDTDISLLDSTLLLSGLRWIWKKEKGFPYAEDFRLFEILLAQASGADGTKPTLSMDGDTRSIGPAILVSPGNWRL